MMDAKFRCVNADALEFELTATMTLEKWKQLRKQLQDNYPSWELGSKIQSLVWQVEKEFTPEEKPEGETT